MSLEEQIEAHCESKWILSKWGCLYSVLKDYNIDVSHVPGRVGEHIVDDFMDLMCKHGYCKKNKEEGDEQ